MILKIDVAFEYGQTVYLKTDPGQLPRIVTGFRFRLNSITYMISCGINETDHFEIEITDQKQVL
jgi:hypothetical protein